MGEVLQTVTAAEVNAIVQSYQWGAGSVVHIARPSKSFIRCASILTYIIVSLYCSVDMSDTVYIRVHTAYNALQHPNASTCSIWQ
jgi:hypothetical protein